MKRALLISVFQILGLISLGASDINVRKFVVEVQVVYNNSEIKKAYGLIYSEKDGKLTIVTVSEIFLKENYNKREIRVFLPNNQDPQKAQLLAIRSYYEYAVLQITTPSNFQWPGELKTASPIVGYQTYILGRDGNLEEYSINQAAHIINVSNNNSRFELESHSKIEGAIGLPVIQNDNIIGITLVDLGERIIAVSLSIIHYYCRDTLDIKSDNYLIGSNNIIFGAYSELPIYLSKYTNSNTLQKLHLINGVYAEVGISSRLSVRFAYNYNYKHTSRNYLVYDNYVQTKTHLKGFSTFLVFKDHLLHSQKTVSYSSIGFSRKQQDFSIRLKNGNWEPFENYNTSDMALPEYCNIYTYETRLRTFLFKNIIGETVFGVNYLDKNHYLISPFSQELKKNRLSINLGISVSFLLMNKKTFRTYIY
ncbi:MAG: hypothetical protein HN778_02355 [Prolixibacteraceae bacterium]|jgi:hypothetical protein|nr:hypothetical protein [Prolixibacteraceae bacterium]MBT6005910.1 hypothetical protein [Prolixibacteraceae bacterium]MBT6762956.1 hypothetical protein [Prolixibacteraceae bacterium]MBT7000227.1 hypothetical protein [Prolixibacteraceae bacterium]MBT7393653.1 hypothetical protein [Prolixibacteraceae bacterium]